MSHDDLPEFEAAGSEAMPERKTKQSDLLISLCDNVFLHHDPDDTPHVTWEHNGARQTHRLRSKAFRSWLCWRAHTQLHLTPNANALQEALGVLEGRAIHDGPLVQVRRGIAEHGGRFYLDLCNAAWEAVEIDAAGWRILSKPPVYFIRGTGTLPLPTPVPGNARALRPFINVADEREFDLVLAWMVGTLQPSGPYPVLALGGRQGCAKTTCARVLIALVDPNKAPVRSQPKSEDDLVVAAQHSRVLCFDNVSSLSADLSDSICRLATGGGLAKRQLYTDADAVVLSVCAPVVLTGIGSYIVRGDLADRAIPVTLKPINDADYKPESEIMAAFRVAAPGIFGGLLDAVSCSIRRRGEVTAATRMADFNLAVEAAALAFGWKPGYVQALLAETRQRARMDLLSDDDLAQELVELVRVQGEWCGTVARLRSHLAGDGKKAPDWLPRSARALGNAVRRLEPSLEAVEIVVERRKTASERLLILRLARGGDAPQVPHAPQAAATAGSGVVCREVQEGGYAPFEQPQDEGPLGANGASGASALPSHLKTAGSPFDDQAWHENAGELVDELVSRQSPSTAANIDGSSQ